MPERKNALAQLFAACWKDEALKARLMSDPKAVLKEHGLDVPDGIDVKVVENADDCVHITLPAPPAGDMDCLLYTSPSPRDYAASRMPSSA